MAHNNNLSFLFPNGFNAAKYVAPAQSNNPPILEAHRVLTGLGFKPPYLQTGKLMRFPDAHDMAKNNIHGKGGWALYNEIYNDDKIIGIMSYGSWHDDMNETWCSASPDTMNNDQRDEFKRAIDAAKRLHEEEDKKLKDAAQIEFKRLWDGYPEASGNHPYLVKKGIEPIGIRQDGDKLVVPCYLGERLVGLQDIYPDGQKFFRKHSTKGYLLIGDKSANKVFVCEGYSTGKSILDATNGLVAVAFDAGNLFATASELKSQYELVICADDDKHGEVNTGMVKAKQVADALKCRVISPITKGTDFNDMVSEKGIDLVKKHIDSLLEIKKPRQTKADKALEALRPDGILGDIYDYYNLTSRHDQKGFAIQTAIAVCSLVCARNFKTDNDNYSSIFLLNVGETATGKEHCKSTINKIMRSVNMDSLIIGDGFTSAGGVMTELQRKPRCISVVDEFGLYLSAANNSGSAHMKEANSYLMQAFGRCNDMMMGKNYSTQSVGGSNKDINDRRVYNPALTLVGITTPDTFISNINMGDVHSGFLNRFLVHVSYTQPAVAKRVTPVPVPNGIRDWIFEIDKRAQKQNPIETSVDMAKQEIIQITDAAWEEHTEFEQEMVNKIIKHKAEGLGGLFGRGAEIALRLSLIHALSRDSQTKIVADVDMVWAVNYVRASIEQLYKEVAGNMVANRFEADKLEVLKYIEGKETQSVSQGEMNRQFKKHPTRVLEDILNGLIAAELIVRETSGNIGRPTVYYTRTE